MKPRFCFRICSRWLARSRRARMPACTLGCRVLTRPSSISGKPGKSETSVTGTPPSRNILAVPPVDRISTWRPARNWPNSTMPLLSVTLIRARAMGLITSLSPVIRNFCRSGGEPAFLLFFRDGAGISLSHPLTEKEPQGFMLQAPEIFLGLMQLFLADGVPDLAHCFIQAQGLEDDVHLLIIDQVLGLGPLLHHDEEAGAGMAGADLVQEPLVVQLLGIGDDEIVGALLQGLQCLGHGAGQLEALIAAE